MIIVTGGAGFIGSNIIKYLNDIGYNNILVVDNLKNGTKYINIVDLKIIDYIDKKDFISMIINEKNLGHIDAVFHEGACSSTTEWDGKYMMQNNYQYSKNFLHYCLKRTIPFLYASSAAIYGYPVKKFIEHSNYEKPINIYSYSKFLFDQYVRTILPHTNSQICGLRYFNVYGPREEHKNQMASIIFHLNNQIHTNKYLKLFIGSKNFKRDFIYIDDVVAINMWCWKNNISGIFNCGTGQAESFKTIALIILDFYRQGQIKYIPFPDKLKKHYQYYTKANLNHLYSTGYNKPFKNINEGIIKYLNWLNYKK